MVSRENKPVYSLSEVAKRLKVLPRVLSDAFYQGLLDDERCMVLSGRRLIPAEYLPEVVAKVREITKRKKAKGASATRQTRHAVT